MLFPVIFIQKCKKNVKKTAFLKILPIELRRFLTQNILYQKCILDNRLSAIAGSKMRDNNPGITDLSDPNRPLKLSEKITELYDDEWTTAIDGLEDKGVEENEGIQMLLEIIKVDLFYDEFLVLSIKTFSFLLNH